MATTRSQRHAATHDEIKKVARQQMAQYGTAGISIRSITRQMGLTAPAIYRYFSSLDDLITELIVDSFNDLADHVESAYTSARGQSYVQQLMAVLMAYREWALTYPVDFQLIYGNPIPGYVAPAEITVPAVVRVFAVIIQLMAEALEDGKLVPSPQYATIPPEIEPTMQMVTQHDGYHVPVLAVYLATVGWPVVHGLIMLELFEHIQPVVGDIETFYRVQIENLLVSIGMIN
jgi:AcrR family transcriptional regulator